MTQRLKDLDQRHARLFIFSHLGGSFITGEVDQLELIRDGHKTHNTALSEKISLLKDVVVL